MTEIKIYVANLKAYNEGTLKGEWFTLPVDWEEIVQAIFDQDELDEYGNPQGDYAIHDYEAPFKINEFSNIDTLNEIAEMFELMSEEDIDIVCELKEAGILDDLRQGQDMLGQIVRYHDCKNMDEVACQVVEERYGNNEEYKFFLRNFNYKSYGEELDSMGTYLFINDNMAIEYIG